LKILFVQDHLKIGGGARAASRWASLLTEAGHRVSRVAGDEASAAGFLLTGKPPRGLGRLLELIFGHGQRKKTVMWKWKDLLEREKPDLVWLHNVAGGEKWGWSEEMLTTARRYAPAIWTLHDMWALGEGSESYWQEDSVVEGGRGQEVKGEALKGSRVQRVCGESAKYPVTITAPSQWLADLTKKITGQECVFLPNPIDLKIFSPGDRQAARQRFGLPEKGLVVLAGADSLMDQRKGFDLLRGAWKLGSFHDAILALFGRHGESRSGERYLGNLTSDEEMVAAYQAADLYVHPARMENAPCTIQESLACGTPVLAFAVGGIPEMVVPRKTGVLVARLSPESLAETLASALADPEQLREMWERCRKHAEEIWKPEKLMRQFAELARGLMAESR
jgi:glycosyltransferase involved in cell wall biosynthesis